MSRPLVLHLIASNFFGGPEKQVFEHAVRASAGRYEIAVGSYADTTRHELIERVESAGLRGFLLPSFSPLNLRQLRAVQELLAKTGATLLCTHGYKFNVVGMIAAKRCEIPHIAFCRGRTWENKRLPFYNWLDWKCMRFASRVVAVSDGIKEQLIRSGIKPGKIVTIHNAIDVDTFLSSDTSFGTLRSDISVGRDMFLFGALGRFSPEKGQVFLIKAFRQVVSRFSGARLVLCGDGVDEEKLRSLVKELGLEDVVVFAGFRRDVANVFRSIDAMVLPSLSEGLPNVVLESFASEVPVVATRVGGVPELVYHEKTGLLANPSDPADLAERMCELISNDKMRSDLVKAAKELVVSDFGFDEQSQKLIQLYDDVLCLEKVKR